MTIKDGKRTIDRTTASLKGKSPAWDETFAMHPETNSPQILLTVQIKGLFSRKKGRALGKCAVPVTSIPPTGDPVTLNIDLCGGTLRVEMTWVSEFHLRAEQDRRTSMLAKKNKRLSKLKQCFERYREATTPEEKADRETIEWARDALAEAEKLQKVLRSSTKGLIDPLKGHSVWSKQVSGDVITAMTHLAHKRYEPVEVVRWLKFVSGFGELWREGGGEPINDLELVEMPLVQTYCEVSRKPMFRVVENVASAVRKEAALDTQGGAQDQSQLEDGRISNSVPTDLFSLLGKNVSSVLPYTHGVSVLQIAELHTELLAYFQALYMTFLNAHVVVDAAAVSGTEKGGDEGARGELSALYQDDSVEGEGGGDGARWLRPLGIGGKSDEPALFVSGVEVGEDALCGIIGSCERFLSMTESMYARFLERAKLRTTGSTRTVIAQIRQSRARVVEGFMRLMRAAAEALGQYAATTIELDAFEGLFSPAWADSVADDDNAPRARIASCLLSAMGDYMGWIGHKTGINVLFSTLLRCTCGRYLAWLTRAARNRGPLPFSRLKVSNRKLAQGITNDRNYILSELTRALPEYARGSVSSGFTALDSAIACLQDPTAALEGFLKDQYNTLCLFEAMGPAALGLVTAVSECPDRKRDSGFVADCVKTRVADCATDAERKLRAHRISVNSDNPDKLAELWREEALWTHLRVYAQTHEVERAQTGQSRGGAPSITFATPVYGGMPPIRYVQSYRVLQMTPRAGSDGEVSVVEAGRSRTKDGIAKVMRLASGRQKGGAAAGDGAAGEGGDADAADDAGSHPVAYSATVPQHRLDPSGKFTTYCVSMRAVAGVRDRQGEPLLWDVWKRYSEFDRLYKDVCRELAVQSLPVKLPRKRLWKKSTDPKCVEERRTCFVALLRCLIEHPTAFGLEQVRRFLALDSHTPKPKPLPKKKKQAPTQDNDPDVLSFEDFMKSGGTETPAAAGGDAKGPPGKKTAKSNPFALPGVAETLERIKNPDKRQGGAAMDGRANPFEAVLSGDAEEAKGSSSNPFAESVSKNPFANFVPSDAKARGSSEGGAAGGGAGNPFGSAVAPAQGGVAGGRSKGNPFGATARQSRGERRTNKASVRARRRRKEVSAAQFFSMDGPVRRKPSKRVNPFGEDLAKAKRNPFAASVKSGAVGASAASPKNPFASAVNKSPAREAKRKPRGGHHRRTSSNPFDPHFSPKAAQQIAREAGNRDVKTGGRSEVPAKLAGKTAAKAPQISKTLSTSGTATPAKKVGATQSTQRQGARKTVGKSPKVSGKSKPLKTSQAKPVEAKKTAKTANAKPVKISKPKAISTSKASAKDSKEKVKAASRALTKGTPKTPPLKANQPSASSDADGKQRQREKPVDTKRGTASGSSATQPPEAPTLTADPFDDLGPFKAGSARPRAAPAPSQPLRAESSMSTEKKTLVVGSQGSAVNSLGLSSLWSAANPAIAAVVAATEAVAAVVTATEVGQADGSDGQVVEEVPVMTTFKL